jgi:hypothetical protein
LLLNVCQNFLIDGVWISQHFNDWIEHWNHIYIYKNLLTWPLQRETMQRSRNVYDNYERYWGKNRMVRIINEICREQIGIQTLLMAWEEKRLQRTGHVIRMLFCWRVSW